MERVFIRGVKGEYKNIMNILEGYGGKRTNDPSSSVYGQDWTNMECGRIFTITPYSNKIVTCLDNTYEAEFAMDGARELHLPVKEIEYPGYLSKIEINLFFDKIREVCYKKTFINK